MDDFRTHLAYLHRQIHVTREAIRRFAERDLRGVRIVFSIHLDIKVVPVVEAVVRTGAQTVVLTCNPLTVRDEVVRYLAAVGAQVDARYGMSERQRLDAVDRAIAQSPQFICEMGGDVQHRLVTVYPEAASVVRAGMEATGTGILRLQGLSLPFPVFNWDDLPLKQGLHNRYLVGLTVWNTFLEVARVTLYGKRVLVVGYGLVGEGIAAYARRLGAVPLVADPDPARQIFARHNGCVVTTIEEALPQAEIVVTATGRERVVREEHFPLLREGAFLLNAGHSSREIDVDALRRCPLRSVRPHLEEIEIGDRRIYLLAQGAMFNLAAGPGDPYDAFDVTSALMLEGIGYMLDHHAEHPPGVQLMPTVVERSVAAMAAFPWTTA
ncbi:MAG: adenosylhomocysteinase [Armatimonadota bacterium]|nr:adenosylhomocysteinase [Armatimonadota bacterium]MDR5696183.1 adenosylhomocysteinase [Armatimonadota bacterium]